VRSRFAYVALTALVLALAAPAGAASVFAGHSGWFWASPLPQGNTLRAIDFAGNRGYAVGDFGTVMRSDNGGQTWAGLITGTTTPLRVVRVIDPDTVVVAGKCTLRRTDDGGKSFTTLPWTPAGGSCRTQIRSLAFPTMQSGFLLLSDGNVLHTGDGGQTWARRTAIPGTPATTGGSTVHPTDIFFAAADMGFVTTDAGALYRTTDGGTSWSPVAAAPQHLDSIWFRDTRTGFAAGGASVLRTSDGGITWVQQGVVAPPESIRWIRCGGESGCVAATERGDELLRTDDGGLTWTPISPASHPLYATAYTSSGGVVAVGRDGTTVASPDGGHNFSTISESLDEPFSLVRASSPMVAVAAGKSGALARTTDGGHEWTPLPAPVADDIVDVSFPTDDVGFALARGNVLTSTEDGGKTWRLLDIGTFVSARAVVALDSKNAVLIMSRGLRRTSNGGLDFLRVRQMPLATASLLGGGRAGNGVFAFGNRTLAISADRGATWRALELPQHEQLKAVDFTSATSAYALTRDGRAWKTANGARTWKELPGLGSEIGTTIAFGGPNDGYVAVPEFGHDGGGYLMRTTDGGATWRPQLVDSKPIRAGALDASTPATAFAIAGSSHLLATDRGGDIGERTTLTLSIRRQRPGRPGVITISGTLAPADGGETVVVSKREGRSSRWSFRAVTVSSSGRFSVFTNVTHTTQFVAQWSGDDEHVGAGTPVVTVGVGRRFVR
jgi:photosystem II stability/assembly factor-like uncharacterized protein